MNEWKIIESLPSKIVTQEDLRRKGSWIAPLLLVLPGLVPIWLGIPILPTTIVCQPVGVSSLQCEKKQELLGIPLYSQSYTQPASKPKPSTEVIPGNTFPVLIGVAWVGGLGSLLLLSACFTVTLTTCTIERATNRISISKKTALRQRVTTYLTSEVEELMLKLPSSATTIEGFAGAVVKIKVTTLSGKSVLLYSQPYDKLPEVDKLLVSFSQLLHLPYKLVLDLGLEVWKFEAKGKISNDRLGKCLAEYTFKDIAKVETETLEEGKNANNIYRYRVNLVTNDGKRLAISEFISEDVNATNTSYAKIWANQVSDHLRQFINFPAIQ
jgi:hypothetical protein